MVPDVLHCSPPADQFLRDSAYLSLSRLLLAGNIGSNAKEGTRTTTSATHNTMQETLLEDMILSSQSACRSFAIT